MVAVRRPHPHGAGVVGDDVPAIAERVADMSAAVHPVRSAAGLHDVVAIAAAQVVVAPAANQLVIAAGTVERATGRRREQMVALGRTNELLNRGGDAVWFGVVARVPADVYGHSLRVVGVRRPVIALIAVERVGTRAAEERVGALAAVEDVVAGSAVKAVRGDVADEVILTHPPAAFSVCASSPSDAAPSSAPEFRLTDSASLRPA